MKIFKNKIIKFVNCFNHLTIKMKKSNSREEVSISAEDSKITIEDQDLKFNEKLEELPNFEPESKIETQEEESNNEREENSNERNTEQTRSIKTIETKNSKYIGEVSENNKKDGLGVCYYSNGDKYIGQFKDGKKNGIGKFSLANGEVFQGEFSNDTLEGYLEHIGKNGVKQGYAKKFQFISGAIEITKGDSNYYSIQGNFEATNENIGIGKMMNNKKRLSYTGEMLNFISNGFGLSTVKDKFTYQGNHQNGKFTGYGEVFNPDGSKFFGFFNNNLRNGFSLAICKDGKFSFGKYCYDIRTGPFIVSSKGVLRLELWNNGFKSKLIEKLDAAKTYIKNFYPEFDWINRVNFKNISDIYVDVYCNEYKVPIPPPMTNETLKMPISPMTNATLKNNEESKSKEVISIKETENIEKEKIKAECKSEIEKIELNITEVISNESEVFN